MTTAEKIAARFDDDGLTTTDATGKSMCEVCSDAGRVVRGQGVQQHLTQYIFADGSAITVADGAWDIGYTDCFCWRGEGHDDDCRMTE